MKTSFSSFCSEIDLPAVGGLHEILFFLVKKIEARYELGDTQLQPPAPSLSPPHH
jgi:hypothetical protein